MLNIAIVGGGAAGFFAAIAAKEQMPNAQVTIYEKGKKVLAKVAVTGGGRCNLTNSFAGVTDLKQVYPRGDKLMKRLLKRFSHEDTYKWFEKQGVKLVTQTDECVFPQSQSSQSIIDCLVGKAKSLGVKVCVSHELKQLSALENGDIQLMFGNQKALVFNRVAITTGGHSQLHSFQYLQHTCQAIAPLCPSLFTFNVEDGALKSLMGTVVDPVYMSMMGTKWRSEGALLITHWGMSGPATLKLSSYGARMMCDLGYRFSASVNWVHQTNVAKVGEVLNEIVNCNPQKQLDNVKPFNLSTRLWGYLLGRMQQEPTRKWGELGKKGMNKMVETLTNDVYKVTGKGAWKDEFVTCGGVDLGGINLNTLESKVIKNLYFAGEVLDIDAITGGFNLQAAWTTGWVVGCNIVQE